LDRDFGSHLAGADFHPPLLDALHQCSAAVVIWTPSAISASPWVVSEVSYLKQARFDLDRDFILLPVFADGASPKDLKTYPWSALELDRVQGLEADSPTLLDDIGSRLTPAQEAWDAQRQYGSAYDWLVAHLEGVSDSQLTAALQKFGAYSGEVQGLDRPGFDAAIFCEKDSDYAQAVPSRSP
jgi:hypothetical protein